MLASHADRPRESSVRTADGRRLACRVSGAGPDLVVLEAGLAAGAAFWDLVQRDLAADALVVSYDRAGYGGSDPGPVPRTLDRLAADLAAVAGAFPHEHLVLVAHSWGGPIARSASARLLPQEALLGLVLVDPVDEHADFYHSASNRIITLAQAAGAPLLQRLGLLRPAARWTMRGLPEPARTEAAEAISTRGAVRAMVQEDRVMSAELAHLLRRPLRPAAVPVRVISAGQAAPGGKRVRRTLTAAHRRFAARVGDGEHSVARLSGHLIPITAPQLVTAQVRELLGA